MGCKPNSFIDCDADEEPLHEVELDAYWIDRVEVSVAEYTKCVYAGKCKLPGLPGMHVGAYWSNESKGVPLDHVCYSEAVDYCAWAGKRLCTEAEWEKAARGTNACLYPWGNTWPTCEQALFIGCTPTDSVANLSEVTDNEAGASPYGVLNMAGNVSEWVSDWYVPDFYLYGPVSNPKGPASGQWRVERGGSFWSSYSDVTSWFRWMVSSQEYCSSAGLRCCSSY